MHVDTKLSHKYRLAQPDEESSKSANGFSMENRASAILQLIITIAGKIIRLIYRHEKFYIFSFDLANRAIPRPKIASDIRVRTLRTDDRTSFVELWQNRNMKSKRFAMRMANGYIGTGTWCGKKLVGVNWLVTNKDFDCITKLWFKIAPDCCYALDLYEHKDFKDRGIGLATLVHSMQEAKRLGFRTMFIATSQYNKKMIVSARYLLGYEQVGTINTSFIFRKPFSRWSIGDRRGRGRTMPLGN